MLGFQFVTSPKNWRRIGHMISDAIYKALTGEDGYFDTRIVFIQESGPKDKRIKRLAIMDQDGANIRQLTDGKDLVLTPRFSPDSAGDHLHVLCRQQAPDLSLQYRDAAARDRRRVPDNMQHSRRASRPTASASS